MIIIKDRWQFLLSCFLHYVPSLFYKVLFLRIFWKHLKSFMRDYTIAQNRTAIIAYKNTCTQKHMPTRRRPLKNTYTCTRTHQHKNTCTQEHVHTRIRAHKNTYTHNVTYTISPISCNVVGSILLVLG